jgi:vancomycin resistance protein YoaR
LLRYSDFGRQIPFGTGTSISYNYLDYRVRNDSDNTFQLRLWVDDEYLCGELRVWDCISAVGRTISGRITTQGCVGS